MNQSQTIGALAAALAKAQAQIKNAVRGAENPFYQSHYADLASVRDTYQKALAENGLALVQSPFTRDGRVGVSTTLLHSSGEWITGEVDVKPAKDDAQAFGSAITYLRRYSAAAFVGVATEDDDGESAQGRVSEPPVKKPSKKGTAANQTPPATKPTSTPAVPKSVADLKPGESCNVSGRVVEKIWQPEGKKTKRVRFQGDPTHYVTFHHMDEVQEGQAISGVVSCAETDSGAVYYELKEYQPF